MPKTTSKKSRPAKKGHALARRKHELAPPLPVVEGPVSRSILVRDLASAREASKAAAAARELIRETELQCVCMELEGFFQRHPEVSEVHFQNEIQGDDEGGEECWMQFEVDFVKGTPEARAKASYADGNDGPEEADYDERLRYELDEELSDIFPDDLAKQAVGSLKVKRDEALEKFARRLMGKAAQERWKARRERADIAEAAGQATAASDPVRL